MSLTKEQVIELIKTLPDDITVDDIMGELFFKSQVDEGLAQLDRGEGIPHEDQAPADRQVNPDLPRGRPPRP